MRGRGGSCPVERAIDVLRSRFGPEGLQAPAATRPGSYAASDLRPRCVIAFSGGLDSTVLLDACARGLGADRLVAAHVHHGLQPEADAWVEHCRLEASLRGVRFECLRLGPVEQGGEGLESWARRERYRVLWDLAIRERAAGLLTAHHADDLAETLLMRLARGTGLDGLAGALPESSSGPQGIPLVRPLLRLTRGELAEYARGHRLEWIDDPMNRDSAYRRVAFRDRVLPVLSEVAPGAVHQLARAQGLLAQAAHELDELARADFERARIVSRFDEPPAIDRRGVASLSPFRQAQLYRFWWRLLEGGAGALIPSEAQSAEWCSQMLWSSASQAIVHRGRWSFVRYRDRIEVWAHPGLADVAAPDAVEFEWRGEAEIDLPGWAGRLRFWSLNGDGRSGLDEHVEAGRSMGVAPIDPVRLVARDRGILFSAPWRLEAGESTARMRVGSAGGETHVRLQADAPSRSLRKIWQSRAIPPVLRPWLPLVEVDGHPVLAAGVGAVFPKDRREVARGGPPGPPSGEPLPGSPGVSNVRSGGFEGRAREGEWFVLCFEPEAGVDPRHRFVRTDGI